MFRILCLTSLLFVACGDDAGSDQRSLIIAFADVPAQAPGRSTLDVALSAHWDDGRPAASLAFDLSATGGGSLAEGGMEASLVTTGADGVAHVAWTLGAMPVSNTLVADAGAFGRGTATVMVDPPSELTSAPFGEVEAFLAALPSDGSTEDLVFAPDGRLVMAHGGASPGLFAVAADGAVSAIATSGEAFKNPLGLAYDTAGVLYVADGGAKALLRVSGAAVEKLADHDGVESFLSPNDVAVGPDGTVFLSDPCTTKVYAVDPASGAIRARIAFDPASEGGPNGVVVGPDGALWMTTENTALFCGLDSVELTAPVAGLFRIPYADGAFGAKETIAAGVGVFGDGLAFDAEDNLYAIFDTVEGLALDESIVFVLPAGRGQPASGRPSVTGGTRLTRAFATSGKVYANLAFGRGAFGETTLYLAMLRLVLVPGSPRGLERVDVGIAGAPLPPQ